MTKLHELLAAEKRVTIDTNTILQESTKIFTGNHSVFLGREIKFKLLLTDNMPESVQSTIEQNGSEKTDPALYVEERLKYTLEGFQNGLQLAMDKEQTNTLAKADLVVDGTVLATDVPATALLSLEKRLNSLIPIVEKLPTRDPMIDWEEVLDQPNVYRSPTETRSVTRKAEKEEVIVPATDKHPAKTRAFTIDEVYAKREVTNTNTLISSQRKMELMNKLSALISACRAARSNANEQVVQETSIASAVCDYLLG